MGQSVSFASITPWRGNTPSVLSEAEGRAVTLKQQARLERWLGRQEPESFLLLL